MRSKVHPQYTTKYRVGHWSAYEQALVQRGDVTLWLSADATDAWRPSPSGRPGAPKTFSDCAIETALTLRLVFRLPLRQAEGFLRSVLSLMGVDLAAPDHTTLSRRSQSLAVEFRRIPSRGPIHLIVDSTGRSIVGEGEWAAVQHGGRGHRGWKTRHLAVDRGGVIVAHALTEPTVDAATIGIDLIETVDDEIARVTADAAYETVARRHRRFRRCSSWYRAQTGPRSASSLRIVGLDTSVMRAVARILFPSTSAATTWTRLDVLNLFMGGIILERSSIDKKETTADKLICTSRLLMRYA